MTPNPFSLQRHLDVLDRAAAPRLALDASSMAELVAWQTDLRAALARRLGLSGRPPSPIQAETVQVIDRGRYVEEKVALSVGEQVQVPLYVLVPKGEPPFPAVLAFHGHDPSVHTILGNDPDEPTASLDRDTHFARALAEAGYLVCAVAQRGMGERTTDQAEEHPHPRSCRHLAFAYMMRARTLLGERCWDGMNAVSYLHARPDVQPGRLGCTGHSGGGTTALFLAALDARVTVAVISGYFCSFRDSILAMPHCECNYVPGLLELAEMGDIAALIAPRPLAVIHGQDDPIFPVHATRAQFQTVARAYALCGSERACWLHVHPGGHTYDLAASRAWFDRWWRGPRVLRPANEA